MNRMRLWVVTAALAVATTMVVDGAQGPAAGGGQAAPAPQGLRQFSGSPIDVDYQGANLRTVLRQPVGDRRHQPRHRSERARTRDGRPAS